MQQTNTHITTNKTHIQTLIRQYTLPILDWPGSSMMQNTSNTYMHTYKHIHTHKYIHTYMHTYTYTLMQDIYIHAYIYTHTYIHTNVQTICYNTILTQYYDTNITRYVV